MDRFKLEKIYTYCNEKSKYNRQNSKSMQTGKDVEIQRKSWSSGEFQTNKSQKWVTV